MRTLIKLSGCTREINHPEDSPEGLAAAYARISRSKDSLETLRNKAYEDLSNSERSCDSIVHGMSHKSIQEGVVFNFDIEHVSRIAVEDIEHHRLASYTERSYRYCEANKDSIHIPEELEESELVDKYIETARYLIDKYFLFKSVIKEHYIEKLNWNNERADKQAQDDARYILPLCLTTSIGMTINARSLSYMIRRLKSLRYKEANNIGDLLLKEGMKVSPVLLRHTSPTAYDFLLTSNTYENNLKYSINKTYKNYDYYSRNALILKLEFYNHLLDMFDENVLDSFSLNDKLVVVEKDLHSPLPRYTEFGNATCLCLGSSVFFAQLKRHRMSSMFPQHYFPYLGATIPVIFKLCNLENEFMYCWWKAVYLYIQIFSEIKNKNVANYILPCAARKPILFQMNMRELHHFISLRADKHAGKEIRFFAKQLNKQLQYQNIFKNLHSLFKGKEH